MPVAKNKTHAGRRLMESVEFHRFIVERMLREKVDLGPARRFLPLLASRGSEARMQKSWDEPL